MRISDLSWSSRHSPTMISMDSMTLGLAALRAAMVRTTSLRLAATGQVMLDAMAALADRVAALGDDTAATTASVAVVGGVVAHLVADRTDGGGRQFVMRGVVPDAGRIEPARSVGLSGQTDKDQDRW